MHSLTPRGRHLVCDTGREEITTNRKYWSGRGGEAVGGEGAGWKGRTNILKAKRDRLQAQWGDWGSQRLHLLQTEGKRKRGRNKGALSSEDSKSCSFILSSSAPPVLCGYRQFTEQASEGRTLSLNHKHSVGADKPNEGIWICRGHICAETYWRSICKHIWYCRIL